MGNKSKKIKYRINIHQHQVHKNLIFLSYLPPYSAQAGYMGGTSEEFVNFFFFLLIPSLTTGYITAMQNIIFYDFEV